MLKKLKKYHNNIETLADDEFINVIYFDFFSFNKKYIEFYRIFDDIGRCSGYAFNKWIIGFYSSFVWHHDGK